MSLKTAFAFLELSHGWKNTEDCYHFWNITKILRDCECHVFVYVLYSTVRDVNVLSFIRDVRNTCLQLNVSFNHWDQEIPRVLLSFKIFKRFVLKLDKVYFSMLRCIALHCWISHALELALRLTSYRLQMRLHTKCNFEHYRS